ncbi:MAG: hypothetical protein KDD03_11550 [Gelidibacter sp.]|nr:hypothetical protein [Gelidibacter sp.]
MEHKQIVIEFHPIDLDDMRSSLKKEIPEVEIISSNGFSGDEIINVLLYASPFLISKVLNFYIKNKKNTRVAKIKIDKKSIELSGMSTKEIRDLTDNGDLKKIYKIINKKKND